MRSTRRSRCRPTFRPGSPATRSSSCSRRAAPRGSSIPGAAPTRSASPTSSRRRPWAHIEEVETLGGMTRAIEAGIPKLKIEEAAARTQARIDSGHQKIIGVNAFRPSDEASIDLLKVENQRVRSRSNREAAATQGGTRSGRRGRGARGSLAARNPVRAIFSNSPFQAARAKATVGEISYALEKVWGRHRAEIRAISGVYKRGVGQMSDSVERVRRLVEAFEHNDGRRPRLLVAKVGQDGHDRGQGDRLRVRGSRLRRRHSARSSPRRPRPRVRRSRTTCTSSRCRRSPRPLDPCSRAEGRTRKIRPRRHHDRRRRRDSAAGFRSPPRAGASAIFPPGTVIADAAVDLIGS